MSTHVPGFQSFSYSFSEFCIGQISHQQHKGKGDKHNPPLTGGHSLTLRAT